MYENNYPNNYNDGNQNGNDVNYSQQSNDTYHYGSGASFSGAERLRWLSAAACVLECLPGQDFLR